MTVSFRHTRTRPTLSRRRILATPLLAAPFIAGHAWAQERFPSRTIEVVTHAGVGGGTDITARMMMVQAPAEFGQELVVVNRVGGSGAAALAYAASKPRDGHTILLITQTHLLTVMRNRAPGISYSDIVGLARATEDPQVLMVGKGSPHKTAQAFIAAAKAQKMKFGTTQVGGVDHLAVFGFAKQAGIQQPTIVPFRGGGDIAINLVSGNVDAALLNPSEPEAQIRAGDVIPLLTLHEERIATLKDVPTAKELGFTSVHATTRGFAVLKGVPEDRIAILEDRLVKSMSSPLFRNYLDSTGQARSSVAGRQVWQAQLDAFNADGREALTALGVAQ
ncbi:tripartite tricarboxylate transporter substrate binding protein [Elioraea sp.]|uniref:Bug family tripartite tricarboxylate transporter substrate binding protein n=1 Tax=Elioraea sp. TaxID=2185103 RepID=UPI0025BC0658|nr:tripartite tricarboxylate transporter substrate binding protein [Elioraea sp.]